MLIIKLCQCSRNNDDANKTIVTPKYYPQTLSSTSVLLFSSENHWKNCNNIFTRINIKYENIVKLNILLRLCHVTFVINYEIRYYSSHFYSYKDHKPTMLVRNYWEKREKRRRTWSYKQLKTLLREHMVKLKIISLYI